MESLNQKANKLIDSTVKKQITATLYVSGAGWTDMKELGTITDQNLSSLVNNEQTLARQQAGAKSGLPFLL